MKSPIAFLFFATSSVGITTAFSSLSYPPMTSSSSTTTPTPTSLLASRRSFFSEAAATAVSLVAVVGGTPSMAWAEPRAMYLTEPTDEFKENEAKAAAFKRQQLLAKKDFMAALEKLMGESDDADALVADLKTIKGLVATIGGLPLGIKKDELFKMIRSKKAKGFWPTPVEVA